jgi:hypothetical protein
VIVAVPEQHRDLVTTVGQLNPPPPRMETFTWWHWACTVCWTVSKPQALFSHPESALERGHNYHLAREQCETEGQLALFASAGAP